MLRQQTCHHARRVYAAGDRTQAPHLLGWHSPKEPHPSRRAPSLIFRSPSWAWSQSRRVKAPQPVSDRSLYLSLSSRRRLRGGFWKPQVMSPHFSLPSLQQEVFSCGPHGYIPFSKHRFLLLSPHVVCGAEDQTQATPCPC